MKKCASCTKDLPDAALHCVFCGAKQPPAPAVSGGMAKTVMGHGSQEMIEQLKAQAAAAQRQPPPSNLPAAAPYSPPRPMPGSMPPAGPFGGQPPGPARPMGPGPNAPVPTAGSVAPTMMVPSGGIAGFTPTPGPVGGYTPGGSPPAPSPPMGGPMGGGPMGNPMGGGPMGNPMGGGPMGGGPMGGGPMGGGPMGGGPMGGGPMGGGPMGNPMGGGPSGNPMGGGPMGNPMGPGPMGPGPMGPGPMGHGPGGPSPMPPRPHTPTPPPVGMAPNPYMSIKPAKPGRPIEPWKDSLRLQMFIWGGVLILAFLTPTAIEPDLAFHWNTIIDGEGLAKLDPLLIASVGLLGVLLAAIPTSPPPRGLIAGLLGLIGFVVPTILALSKHDFGLGQVLQMLLMLGFVLLVPGLLLRSQYTDSIMPRIFVTVGVLCVLAAYLIPVNDKMALVRAFDTLADAEGKDKVHGVLELLPLVYALLALLVWLPGPGGGMGTVTAWLWITLPALEVVASLLLGGHIGDFVKARPYAALMSWAPVSAYLVFIGYGFATILGKQLE